MREPQIFISSNFDEFRNLRSQLSTFIYEWLEQSVTIFNLDDGMARMGNPLEESLVKVAESDLLILIVGAQYGGTPTGHTRSYAHLEYLEALGNDVPVLVYVQNSNAALDPRVASWHKELAEGTTFGRLSGEPILDVQRIVRGLNGWLQHREEQLSKQLASAGGRFKVGQSLGSATGSQWRDDCLNRLDLEVFDKPSQRESEVGSLVDLPANREWNEACQALAVGHSGSALAHFERAVDLRRNDGLARFWMVRLLLARARSEEDYDEVVDEAYDAIQVLSALGHDERGTALARLVRAKSLRHLGRYREAYEEMRVVVESPLGSHSESHLELALAAAVVGQFEQSQQSARQAFIRFPSSLVVLKRELSYLSDVDEGVYNDLVGPLVPELQQHVSTMLAYRRRFSTARNAQRTTALDRLTRSNDPVELARACQSLSSENLKLLQQSESSLRRSAYEVAQISSDRVDDPRPAIRAKRDIELESSIQWLVVASIAFSVLGGIALGSVAAGLVFFVVGSGLAVVGLLWSSRHAQNAEAQADIRYAAARRTQNRELAVVNQQFQDAARWFVSMVDRYEQEHLFWRLYSPERGKGSRADRRYRRVDRRNPDDYRIVDEPLRPEVRQLRVENDPGSARHIDQKVSQPRFGLYAVDEIDGHKTAIRYLAYCQSDDLIDLRDQSFAD